MNIRDLTTGDTVTLRFGGVAVVAGTSPSTGYRLAVKFNGCAAMVVYEMNGQFLGRGKLEHPFDITAVHKASPSWKDCAYVIAGG
jgi:hypothetical protein